MATIVSLSPVKPTVGRNFEAVANQRPARPARPIAQVENGASQ